MNLFCKKYSPGEEVDWGLAEALAFATLVVETCTFEEHEVNPFVFIDGGTMVLPTVFARGWLSYMINDMPQEALGDAMQAQVVSSEWPTASYPQAAALFSLGMDADA